jgi:threonine dehydratase
MSSHAYRSLVRRTPLVPLPDVPGVSLKLESLQRGGSFKIRGACLRLDAMTEDERRRGVVAASAGNHGLGVAAAARALGIRAHIIVPATSPDVKRRGIAALGADVEVGGADYQAAEDEARRRAQASGAVFVSPFDDPTIMRGNGGLLAEEILEQAPDTQRIVCPVGGGGLIAGIAAAVAIEVMGAQPRVNCAMHESLRLGRALTRYDGGATLAEGCEGAVAESTYAICAARHLAMGLVGEDDIAAAVARAYRLGFVVEPSAAVALAAVFAERTPVAGTVIVVTGGNIDPDLLDGCLAGSAVTSFA